MNSPCIETRRILFSGRVQGVGFRWTTNRFAANYPVSGFVRNLADGRVELVAQGPPQAISSLTDDIRKHFRDHIAAAEEAAVAEAKTFSGFTILH